MMHVGFETTPVLGVKRQLGDTWTMLKWQFGGHMGGNPDRNAPKRTADEWSFWGRRDINASPPTANTDLISSDGRLRVL